MTTDNKYPYTEGEDYYTIKDNNIVWSTWDYNSEHTHTDSKLYFDNVNDASLYAIDNNIVIDKVYDYEKH